MRYSTNTDLLYLMQNKVILQGLAPRSHGQRCLLPLPATVHHVSLQPCRCVGSPCITLNTHSHTPKESITWSIVEKCLIASS